MRSRRNTKEARTPRVSGKESERYEEGRREVSASIRINIMGGTHIEEAYDDCADISYHLGGISVETSFNGVEMFYYHQPRREWCDEYRKRIYGTTKKEGGAK